MESLGSAVLPAGAYQQNDRSRASHREVGPSTWLIEGQRKPHKCQITKSVPAAHSTSIDTQSDSMISTNTTAMILASGRHGQAKSGGISLVEFGRRMKMCLREAAVALWQWEWSQTLWARQGSPRGSLISPQGKRAPQTLQLTSQRTAALHCAHYVNIVVPLSGAIVCVRERYRKRQNHGISQYFSEKFIVLYRNEN